MSGVELAQFHQIFFEESLEGLATMEAALLALDDAGRADAGQELIHTIFRAAHSIKGGAATFGFPQMAVLTHDAESLLESLRDGHRAIDAATIELLLRTVDGLRAMFDRARAGVPLADVQSAALGAELGAMMGSNSAVVAAAPVQEQATHNGWRIVFRPHPGMLISGNDPLRLLAELAELGALEVQAHTDALPTLAQLDPTQCGLRWTLTLRGAVGYAAVAGVFDWVEDACDLSIEPLPLPLPLPIAAPPSASAIREVSGESSSVRVSIDKIDSLINLVGELVITQSMLDTFREGVDAERLEQLSEGLNQLARHTRDLQESVLGIRMLPIASVFNRLPRLVRDVSARLGKQVRLELHGAQTELDKTLLEKIADPLVHLVRNAIDHGLELPAQRHAAGKPEHGVLRLSAHHRGGSIVVQVSDDGAGLDYAAITAKAIERGLIAGADGMSEAAIAELIFNPGFSTASVTTDVSGRGVGMDVVRRNVAQLGGSVRIASTPGDGSAFTITLPLTLAIIDGLTAAVGAERYIVPLVSIIESVQATADTLRRVVGGGELFHFRGDYLPVVRLHQVFGCAGARQAIEDGLMIVVESDGSRTALFVDGLIGQQQAVVKSLEANYHRIDGVAGATILADGAVALIVDVGGLVRMRSRGWAV